MGRRTILLRHDEISAGDTTTLNFDYLAGSTERDVAFTADSG